jgi:hypothetical protein
MTHTTTIYTLSFYSIHLFIHSFISTTTSRCADLQTRSQLCEVPIYNRTVRPIVRTQQREDGKTDSINFFIGGYQCFSTYSNFEKKIVQQ